MSHLQPKRTRFRKVQKGRVKGLAIRGAYLAFGDFGLQVLEPGRITARQIEAVRIILARTMKRMGKIWIRVFPDKPITKKPAEVRMGKGKGSPEYWVAPVKAGRILFEITGIPLETAQKAMRTASHKLPYHTRFVLRKDYQSNPS